MNKVICAVILILSLSSPVLADQQPPKTPSANQQQLAAGTKKLWTGIALIGAGAIAIPVTSNSPEDFNALVGGTLMGAGAVLVCWGARQRYTAANPSIRVGIGLGRTKAVGITKIW